VSSGGEYASILRQKPALLESYNGESAARGDQALELQLLIDSAPSLIHTAWPDGHIDFFNQTWLRFIGCSLEDLLGWKWTAFIHPEDVEGIVQKWRASLASGEPFLHECRVRRADGEYRWMLHHKVAVRDGCGQIAKWHGSSIDIEDRKRAEEQLRRSAEELQRSEFYLAEGQRLAHLGSWAFDPAGFDYWSPELFRMYGLDPDRKPPTIQKYLDCIHPQDREFMANLIERILVDARCFDVTKRIVRPGGEVRYIRCVGAPVIENKSLKKYVGSALDVTENELATQELRRREAYLAEAERLSHTGSFGWKPDSGENVWSDETYRIFEYDNTLKPTIDSVLQRVHPQDRALVQQVIEGASQTGTDFEHEHRLLMADGRVKHVHAIAHAVQNASGDREFIGAVTDITGRKTAEEALRSSQAYLAEAQRLSRTGSWAWSPEQDIRYWSEECYRVLSFDPQDGLPRFEDFVQRIHPDDQPGFRELTETATREKAEWEADYRIVHPDGPVRDIHVVGHPVLSTSGDLIEFVGTVIDVTERKRAEQERRSSEMEFRQVLDLAPQQVAVIGPAGERLYANRIALDYLGVSLEEWRQTPGNLFRPGLFIHPDDRERAARAADSHRSCGSAYELEFRVRGADGHYRWFLVRYNPLHDDKGQVKRWYGSLTDIEDRKRAEQKLQQENVALREEIDKASMFEEIVGTSRSLKAVLSRIAKVAPTDSTVLITGETGTGKELIARAVHKRSRRAGRAFISVNCAALPPTLVSSELFGHEKGAFTGATERRLGRFEMADGGTIFLDEVGELLPDTQAALLRVLQEREFERVGGGHPIQVDVRVIAATNRDLNASVVNGSFRQDLFYRLNVFPIEVPPLRERKDDVLMLVEYFVQRYANRAGKDVRSIDQKTLDLLQSYDWPGNIRELQNVIERSIILSTADVFSVDEMWLSKKTYPQASRVEVSLALNGEGRSERDIIEAALAETRGRVSGPSGAAAKLRIPASTLETRIKALKINKLQFKFG
jgi:PAS domain S-box-containing protein